MNAKRDKSGGTESENLMLYGCYGIAIVMLGGVCAAGWIGYQLIEWALNNLVLTR